MFTRNLVNRVHKVHDDLKNAVNKKKEPALLEEVWRMHRQLDCMINEFNNVDMEMVDYVIFKINAGERLLDSLFKAARLENVTAWPVLPPVNQPGG